MLQNEAFIKAAAALAIEVYGFINDDARISFDSVLAFFEAQAIDVWKTMIPFCNSDSSAGGMPFALKVHFFELESILLLKKIWMQSSPIFEYVKQGKEKLLSASGNEISEEQELDFEEYESSKSSHESGPKNEVRETLTPEPGHSSEAIWQPDLRTSPQKAAQHNGRAIVHRLFWPQH